MSTEIIANVSKMFNVSPALVSGSQAELGRTAGKITWTNALAIADRASEWLLSDKDDAIEGMREWAADTGAWEGNEIASWDDDEVLGLFVQSVASELRMMGSDSMSLEDIAEVYAATDWDKKSECPMGYYYLEDGALCVQYYTGS